MPSFDRASAADLMQAATGDGRAAGHIGALLVLDATPAFSVAEARRLLGERIRTVPRLRQRLCRAPPGCGRPYWTDDPAFDIGQHVRQVRCPPPGDERALLDLAAAQLGEPMPRSRPLWSVTFVTDLAGGGTGLLVITDHVLADGIAGLAVLGALADQAESAHIGADRFPAPAPRARELAADAWRGRLRRPGPAGPDAPHQARGLRRIREGMAELGGARPPRRRPATSLNRPVGPRRRLDVIAVDLAAIRDLGHAYGGTVNDVLLAAVAGALRTLLAARGEQLSQVTITVPVAARHTASGGELGNQIGIMPVTVPAAGHLSARISRTAEITRERKSRARGASAALFVPAFLLLARSGMLSWFTDHQRVVQTFVTNLRGPEDPLTFGGATVRAIILIPSTTGNVTVTFAASSYAGTLRITVLSDPACTPDAAALAAALRHELSAEVKALPGCGTSGPSRPEANAALFMLAAHDDDRARRVMHAVLADRAEQGLGQAAVPPAAHHEQVCSLGRRNQRRTGASLRHMRADLDLGVDHAHLGDRLGEDDPGVVLVVGQVRDREHSGGWRDLPGRHRVHHRPGQLGLVDRPPQRGLGRLEAVHSHHDARSPVHVILPEAAAGYWFLIASIASRAACGSRYWPPRSSGRRPGPNW
jgi:diacylglycerol O-acyltransferase / wax synthase